jgi:hypothetical protein
VEQATSLSHSSRGGAGNELAAAITGVEQAFMPAVGCYKDAGFSPCGLLSRDSRIFAFIRGKFFLSAQICGWLGLASINSPLNKINPPLNLKPDRTCRNAGLVA